ncbi:hypothetical protein AC781_11450 [Akkermansia glycaniphila]|nr:hypothetical protein AC781_11450 [Akkermansia glycaniphila]
MKAMDSTMLMDVIGRVRRSGLTMLQVQILLLAQTADGRKSVSSLARACGVRRFAVRAALEKMEDLLRIEQVADCPCRSELRISPTRAGRAVLRKLCRVAGPSPVRSAGRRKGDSSPGQREFDFVAKP